MQRFFWIFLGWMFLGSIWGITQDGVDRDDSRNAIATVESLDYGSVDLRTGSLSFNIPIGQAYPQRNGGQFQLSLQYSSHIYTYINNPETREERGPGGPTEPPLVDTRLALLKWHPNLAYAGLGCMINTGFGTLRIHGSTSTYARKATFTLSDGRQIYFFDKFKEDDTPTENTWFSRGGEYARLLYRPSEDVYEVELANGTIHVFEYLDGILLATQIKDRFSAANSITISYGETTIGGTPFPQWTITDSLSRDFTITFGKKFQPYGDAALEDNANLHPIFLQAPEYFVVTAITVPTIGGTTSDYTLSYDDLSGFQPFHDPHTLDPVFFSEYHAPLLNTLTVPNGETHVLTHYTAAEPGSHIGAIKAVTNSFGGIITWQYTKIFDPDNSGSSTYSDPYMGISKQEIFDRDGTTLLSKNEYLYLFLDPDGIYADLNGDGAGRAASLRRDRVTISRKYETDTEFNDTAHFFNMRNYAYTLSYEDNFSRESRFLQMPGTPLLQEYVLSKVDLQPNAHVLLTNRSYDGSYDSGSSLISEYVAYRGDAPLTQDDVIRGGHDQLVNSRVWISLTHYHESNNAKITYHKDWNQYGLYKTRVDIVDFVTPSDGDYLLEDDLVYKTTYQSYPTSLEAGDRIWVLNKPRFSQVSQSDSNDILKTEFDFNPNNGFLRRMRQIKSLTGVRGMHDRVTENFPGPGGSGRISEVHVYGGDLQSLPFDQETALADLNLSSSNPETRSKMTYEHGSIKTEEARYKNTGNLYLVLKDRNIDANTGLVTKETTPDGVSVSFVYDNMGRQIQLNPLHGARTFTTYNNATATNPAKVTIQTKLNGTVFTDSRDIFNGWGKLVKKRSLHTDNQWTIKEWDYSLKPDGRLNRESTPYEEATDSRTWTVSTFDALGRLASTRLPDNTVTSYTYEGHQKFSESKQIGTGDAFSTETKTTSFDALGRIVQVTQKDDGDGAAADANYTYNTLGKLTQVSLASYAFPAAPQNRTWTYDGLGNLLSEFHPELGGTVAHRNHDSGGRIGESEQKQGAATIYKLSYVYKDPMRRLTQVWDDVENRLVLESFYAKSNMGTSRSAGKLFQVRRHNYVDIGQTLVNGGDADDKEVLVTRTYFYEENNGAISKLRIRTSGSDHTDAMAFEQVVSLTDLGTVDDLGYPQLLSDLRNDVSLTVGHVYHPTNQVLLKQLKVSGATKPVKLINYHPSGIIKNLTYGNNVKKFIALHSNNNLPRTHRISTSGVTDPVTGQAKNFDTGVFVYDGDGNVTDIGDDYYTYDAVGRLTEAMITDPNGTGQSFTYGYDRFGNMTGKDGITISVNHASNRLTEAGYSYDPRGNVLSTDEVSYTYDPFNMTTTSDDSNGKETYIYETTGGGKDLRLLTVMEDGTCKWTLRGLKNKVLRTYERGQVNHIRATKDHVYAGSLAATYEYIENGPIKRQYIVADHLGSVRMRTDGSGRLLREYKYDPFGNDLPGSSTQNDDMLRFTEHERDNDHQTYMLARYYNPKVARFNSVDPVLGTIDDPQSWNRYAYVKNNPIRFVDPTGEKGTEPNLLDKASQKLADLKDFLAFNVTIFTSIVGGDLAIMAAEKDLLVARDVFLTAFKEKKNEKLIYQILNAEEKIASRKILAGRVARLTGIAGLLIQVGILANDAINWKKEQLEKEITAIINDPEAKKIIQQVAKLRAHANSEKHFQELLDKHLPPDPPKE